MVSTHSFSIPRNPESPPRGDHISSGAGHRDLLEAQQHLLRVVHFFSDAGRHDRRFAIPRRRFPRNAENQPARARNRCVFFPYLLCSRVTRIISPRGHDRRSDTDILSGRPPRWQNHRRERAHTHQEGQLRPHPLGGDQHGRGYMGPRCKTVQVRPRPTCIREPALICSLFSAPIVGLLSPLELHPHPSPAWRTSCPSHSDGPPAPDIVLHSSRPKSLSRPSFHNLSSARSKG